jgi:hypothetical protein
MFEARSLAFHAPCIVQPLLFPPALFNYVVNELKRHVLIILNKASCVCGCQGMRWYGERPTPLLLAV